MRLPRLRNPIKIITSNLTEKLMRRRLEKLYDFYREHWGRELTLDDKIAILRSQIEALEWWARQDPKLAKGYLKLAEFLRKELERLEEQR
jgi:protoheme ferro-lyase